MELQPTNGAHVQNGTATNVSKNAPVIEVTKNQTNGKAESSKTKANPLKDEKPAGPQPGESIPDTSKAEPVQTKTEVSSMPVLNLENRLKVVDDLHRKSIQRLNLMKRKGELEAFEVKLASENDELNDNPFQGCKLIIEDDKHRQFITTTPGLIRMVSQYIFNACDEKLKEIEERIVFPLA